jgi:hypothetical protein
MSATSVIPTAGARQLMFGLSPSTSAAYFLLRVLAAFFAAAERRAGPLVRAALRADAERWLADRRRALECACFDRARCDAAE